jgi:hypothetical protein
MLTLANPIYDVVFKTVMENDEVAKGLISALSGLKVLTLTPLPTEVTHMSVPVPLHDVSDPTVPLVRIFRMDFAATVETADGTRRVLIELQKAALTGVESRFRDYLARAYDHSAEPIIAIYMLGYWGARPKIPFIKVRRSLLDGISNEVITPDVQDPFINQLTHDAVVVQIPGVPQLTGDTEIEMALRLFDQTFCAVDKHMLRILESELPYLTVPSHAPAWIHAFVRTLQSAAADPATRNQMKVEDEAVRLVAKYEELERGIHEALAKAEAERTLRIEEAQRREQAEREVTALQEQLRRLQDG